MVGCGLVMVGHGLVVVGRGWSWFGRGLVMEMVEGDFGSFIIIRPSFCAL